MAVIVAAVLAVMVGGISIVVSPAIREQEIRPCVKSRLTTRHSNRHSHYHSPDAGVHSLAAARHAADIPAGHSNLDCARPGNMSLWLVVHGHSHRRSGLEDDPTYSRMV